MPTLLKQFSLDDSPAEPTHKKEKPDYLKGKYISGVATSEPPAAKPLKLEKRKVIHRQTSNSGHNSQPQLIRLLLSENFSPKKYILQLPTLFLGILSYFIAVIILQKIQPAAIKDLILPNSYLPILLAFGFGHFFTAWYLLQNLRRSFLLAILLSVLFSLRIHHFWNTPLVVVTILLFVGSEFLLTYRTHRR